jgi:phage gpG-like protein
MQEIRLNLSRDAARAALRDLPAILAGRKADPTGLTPGIMLRVGLEASSLVRSAFITKARGGTDEAGDSWEPLNLSTLERRRGGGKGGAEILRDTGRLLASLTPGQAGNVQRTEPGAVVIGTNVKYAVFHHHGTAKIPQRRLWPDPQKWPARWRAALARQARDGLAKVLDLLVRAAA